MNAGIYSLWDSQPGKILNTDQLLTTNPIVVLFTSVLLPNPVFQQKNYMHAKRKEKSTTWRDKSMVRNRQRHETDIRIFQTAYVKYFY